MLNINELKFDERGLIPAVVQEADTGRVLMMAWMNRESLEISLREERTCFWSRSRQELWRKGETSGNVQHLVSVTADCDRDTLLVLVEADGPACHRGTETCFTQEAQLFESGSRHAFSLDALMQMLEGRRAAPVEGSYTSYLFTKGLDKILKKVGEESTEVIIAGKARDKQETTYELADLCYHSMVLMLELGISLGDLRTELKGRHVIDRKVKQEKMT